MSSVAPDSALSGVPDALRNPLLAEFNVIVTSYLEHRWTAAELSGGRFCEIVYTILDGYAKGQYAPAPSKPSNFVDACRRLEANTNVPRSLQILIPRLLPALYEIRNNRNVGHVGGDVDPDAMDSSAVVSMASWILAELIRVFHNITTVEAQAMVNELAEVRLPLVWKSGDLRRVLRTDLSLKEQILVLLASAVRRVGVDELLKWTDYRDKSHFTRLLRRLHADRLIEYYESPMKEVELLPPGALMASQIVREKTLKPTTG